MTADDWRDEAWDELDAELLGRLTGMVAYLRALHCWWDRGRRLSAWDCELTPATDHAYYHRLGRELTRCECVHIGNKN